MSFAQRAALSKTGWLPNGVGEFNTVILVLCNDKGWMLMLHIQ